MGDWDDTTATAAPGAQTLELRRSADRAQLVTLVGKEAGRVYPLGEQPLAIGRSAESDLCVPNSDVSRHHARIARDFPGQFVLEDLRSRNGTRVNGLPVRRHTLQYGDKIQIGAAGIFVFTQHDQLDEQLLQLQRLESIGKLASGLAHDFGNLLQVIAGNLDYLHTTLEGHPGVEADVVEALKETKGATERGTEITRRLLALSRREEANSGPVDLQQLVDEVSGLLKRALPKTITLVVSGDTALTVVGDRGELHQVLMNLCLNARDAMPEGGELAIRGARVAITTEDSLNQPYLPEGLYARLQVCDTGTGMDQETKRRLFEPFFTTKDPGQGTGLGLATAFAIVRNHGGHIRVESELDAGTTFEVYLPVKE